MEIYPVKLEIYDEDMPAAKIETFDNCEAHIEVTMLVNATTWKELSEKIHEALISMKLEWDCGTDDWGDQFDGKYEDKEV